MKIINTKLKDLLVNPGYITKEQFEVAKKQALEQKKDIQDVLVDEGFIKDEQLGQLIADSAGFPMVRLHTANIDDTLFNLIPELVAQEMKVVVFGRDKKGIKVGMVNPDDLKIIHSIEKKIGETVVPFFVTNQNFKNALTHYKASLSGVFKDILDKLKDPKFSQEEKDDATIKMVDALMNYGYQNRVSDIHIEPYEEVIMVRFRIDGVLHDVLKIPKEYLEFILTRIKIMARMRTDEHRAAQDGKFRFKTFEGHTTDVRVSIIPVVEGENVVMRLLSAENRQFNLTDLGLDTTDLVKVRKVIKNSHGMILVTGPTGSGKTTTIYSVLKILNVREVHISTIEDPVEYDIEGISQIQVNSKTNLTFAKGLRAIVRQDPDIIVVGEIRDEETAGIAVNSAMTGHLVLSTLHANDAATTLPRLLDFGIEPFLISSTVNAVFAQRLVRKICKTCVVSSKLTEEEKYTINHNPALKAVFHDLKKGLDKITVYKGTGCKVCGQTGYSGRIGVFEVLEVSEKIKDLVSRRASSDEIMKVAKKEGMTTILEDGVKKVMSGVTTIEEVLRVINV